MTKKLSNWLVMNVFFALLQNLESVNLLVSFPPLGKSLIFVFQVHQFPNHWDDQIQDFPLGSI